MEGINDICDTRLKELSTKLPAAILNSKSDNTTRKESQGFSNPETSCAQPME
jgi:hypothetical protein